MTVSNYYVFVVWLPFILNKINTIRTSFVCLDILDIPDAGNIILQFAVNDYKSIWHGNFSFSEDGIYSLPYVKNAHALDINIAFAYTNVSSSTKAYVCELEVNGMYKI